MISMHDSAQGRIIQCAQAAAPHWRPHHKANVNIVMEVFLKINHQHCGYWFESISRDIDISGVIHDFASRMHGV